MGIHKTPLEKHNKALNEKYHIYQRDNKEYNEVIKLALLSCINDLKNDNNLQKIRKNEDIEYASFSLGNIIENISDIVLYVGLIDTNDNYQNAVNITNENEENIEGLTHISNNINGNIQQAAIVAEFSNNVDVTEFIGIIHHELLHLLHKANSAKMAEIVGWSFTYATEICDLYNVNGIPNYENLKEIISNQNLSKNGLIFTLISAMYLLDKDEIQAWRESFNIVNKQLIKRKWQLQKIENIKTCYLHIDEYKTYQFLLQCIHKYHHELSNIHRFLNDNNFDKF